MDQDPLVTRTIQLFTAWLVEDRITEYDECVLLGTYLHKLLFDPYIHAGFGTAFREVEGKPDKILRVILEFEESAADLATLPWEYMFYPEDDKGSGFFIATKGELILARHVPRQLQQSTLKEDTKLTVLLVISRPIDMKIVDSDPVSDALRLLEEDLKDAIHCERLENPNGDTFQAAIERMKPDVVHFVGHGEWDYDTYHKTSHGSVVFVDSQTKHGIRITDREFAQFFDNFKPRLIFLQACDSGRTADDGSFSGVALKLVYSKVPAVVAVQYPIRNEDANAFAKTFYECISEGKDIDVAVQAGRRRLSNYLLG
ncbi:MAG TPA: CHAT domain-containing protein, partial [Nitrososphaera sp.]